MEKEQKKSNKTAFAWIILILLVFIASGLTYLKFFYTRETEAENNEELTPAIQNELQKIVDNFNNSEIIKEKAKENITIKSRLENNVIIVEYESSERKEEYNYTFNNLILITEIANDDNAFKETFKIMVYAVQKKLGNENNIDNLLEGFINNTMEVEGLYRETIEANKITYNIEITKVVKEIGSMDESKEEEEEENANATQ